MKISIIKMKSLVIVLLAAFLVLLYTPAESLAYYSGYPISMTQSETKNRYYSLHTWNSSQEYWTSSTVYGTDYLANNLQVWEFVSFSSSAGKLFSNHLAITTDFIYAWNTLRGQTGAITVTCGYRNAEHNKKLRALGYSSSETSHHKVGSAADIIVPSGYTTTTIRTLAEACGFVYSYAITSSSVHIDAREYVTSDTCKYPTVSGTGPNLYAIALEDALICNDNYLIGFSGSLNISELLELEDYEQDEGIYPANTTCDSSTWLKLEDTIVFH